MTAYYRLEHLAKFGAVAEGNTELADKFFDYYAAVFSRGGALRAREGTDPDGRGPHRPVPVLHRWSIDGMKRLTHHSKWRRRVLLKHDDAVEAAGVGASDGPYWHRCLQEGQLDLHFDRRRRAGGAPG